MRPRIAIPLPLSDNPEYVERSLPQYEEAVRIAGGEAVRIPLDRDAGEVLKIAQSCQAVLLPGASADVDPAKYGQTRHVKTASADEKRDAVDELLLAQAYEQRKPVLGICYGAQLLNVYCRGSLVQHIESKVNHEAGRAVQVAHQAAIDPSSRLAEIVGRQTLIPVNSSHHQGVDRVGDGLRVAARCPDDGVVEAIEGTSSDHFLIAVQWHPERSIDDARSLAIFEALVRAARV